MTRVSARTHFHSSKLIRCLADLAIVDAAGPGTAFAQQLGAWIHFADAIALSAVHGEGIASMPKMQSEARVAAHAAARAEFDRMRAMLAQSITDSFSPGQGKTHIKLPAPMLEPPTDLAAAYTPYRRFYEAHQRDMGLRIQSLRVNARAAAANVSPALRKLAELDAAFDRILRDRESKLLSKVPLLLKKRFEQLFKEHQQRPGADAPAAWIQGEGWLARFCDDMQMLLLAELELRLQPALGLIEAIKQETQ